MVSLYKGHVKRHETHYCRKSPERKACYLCVHFEMDFADGPYCVDDQVPFDQNGLNSEIDCEFFENKNWAENAKKF